MKKIIALLCIVFGLHEYAQAQSKSLLVKEVSLKEWNTTNGFPYKKVAGANLGVTSFEIMDNNRMAFLSDASGEIYIIERANNTTIHKFKVAQAPRDFAYDNGFFYVLYENNVTKYDEQGKLIKSISFPQNILGVVRITRYNNATYLLHPSGNCIEIESAGEPTLHSYSGWITSLGNFVSTKIDGANSYVVGITTADGKKYEKKFSTSLKTAGVYVVGSTKNKIVLDIQTYVSESPIQVERHIATIEINVNGLGNITSDIKLPDCYYVLSDKEILLSPDGTVYNMVTAPDGIHLFSLIETREANTKGYPAQLQSMKYHFNNNLTKTNQQ